MTFLSFKGQTKTIVNQWRSAETREGQSENNSEGFVGGSVVKNTLANAGDTDLMPDPGKFHILWNNSTCAQKLLGLFSRAQEPQLLRLCATTTETLVF